MDAEKAFADSEQFKKEVEAAKHKIKKQIAILAFISFLLSIAIFFCFYWAIQLPEY